MSTQRFDFFMLTAEITYLRDEQPKQRRLNTLIQLPKALVTFKAINNARIALLQRLHDEANIPQEDVKDFVILNISHLGRGTQAEFHESGYNRTSAPPSLVRPIKPKAH